MSTINDYPSYDLVCEYANSLAYWLQDIDCAIPIEEQQDDIQHMWELIDRISNFLEEITIEVKE